jgi:AraC-like DNA-binding protein
MRSPQISVHFVREVLYYLQQQPDEVARLLAQAEIDPDVLNEPGGRVSIKAFADLSRDTMLAMKDEMMGYGEQAQPLGSWATAAQLAISAPNLGEGLQRMARFYRFIPWGIHSRLYVDGQSACFALEVAKPPRVFRNYLYESFLFYIYRACNWLVATQIPLQGVDFSFSETIYKAEYQQLFLSNRYRFNQPSSQIRFAASYLDQPVRQDQLTLRKFLEHTNLAMMGQSFFRRSLYLRIEHILSQRLDSNPSVNQVAELLNMHPHTLRHHLQQEGFQFQEIKNRVRQDCAAHLLNQGLSVEECARQTGFSEASAFIRSFKKWTGQTPHQYRKALREAGA